MASVNAARVYLRYLLARLLHAVLPVVYGLGMRLRRIGNEAEIEAIAPFNSRILYQHLPLVGRDGFLFHRDHDALDQLSAAIVLRPRQLAVWSDACDARLDWCRRHRAIMRTLIIPEKHVVYADRLKGFSRVSPHRPVMQVLDALSAEVRARTLYPLRELRAAGATTTTYLRTDTHWNGHGAFAAYQALLRSLASEIALDALPAAQLTWKERPFVGDLGVRFARERGEMRPVNGSVADFRLVYQNHNFGRGAVHIYENSRRNLPTCVLFRDSFSNLLIPFLMHGFSRLVAVSSLSCHYDLLDQEKPDVVLFVAIERFVATFGRGQTIELPEDAQRLPFADFTGTSLDDIAVERAPGALFAGRVGAAFVPGTLPPLALNTV